MPHSRIFPSDCSSEELADEIVRLSALEDRFLECLAFQCWLSESVRNTGAGAQPNSGQGVFPASACQKSLEIVMPG